MRIVLVGGSSRELAALILRENGPGWAETACFERMEPVARYAVQHRVETVIVELGANPAEDLQQAYQLKREIAGISIVLIANNGDYAMEAFQMGAADYLVKPVSGACMQAALHRARCLCHVECRRIWARTFGHFDLFVDGQPVLFSRQRSKEIMAYLVDRWGGVATNQQIMADLWEDRAGDESARACFQTDFKTLRADLKRAGASQILHSTRGQKWVDTDRMDCDYYHLMQGHAGALALFNGQYMTEYSWAEESTANCLRIKQYYLDKEQEYLKNVDKFVDKALSI